MQTLFQYFVEEEENIEKLLLIFKEQNKQNNEKALAFSLLHQVIKYSPNKNSCLLGIKTFEKVFNMSFLEHGDLLTIKNPYPNDTLEAILKMGADKLLNQNEKTGFKFLQSYLQN